MSRHELVLFEASPLELWKVGGRSITRLLHGLIPELWSTALRRMAEYDAALERHLGEHYSKDQVSDALEDHGVTAALSKLTGSLIAITDHYPRLARLRPPAWLFVPWQLYRDRTLRARVARSLRAINEVMTSFHDFR